MHVLCDKGQTMFKMIFLKQSDGSVLGPEQTLNQILSVKARVDLAMAVMEKSRHTYLFKSLFHFDMTYNLRTALHRANNCL